MRFARPLLLALVGLSAGCALGPGVVGRPEPAVREERAVAALEREDFEGALTELVWLASRCEAGEHRLRALLLLAAAELDPMNPAGSPHVAAGAAATYLLSAEAKPEGLLVARALFRLAADRRGLDPAIRRASDDETGPRPVQAWPVWLAWLAWPACPAADAHGPVRGLPAIPETSTADRMSALEASLASRSDSLATATARLESLAGRASALSERTSALEAELARIESILRDGALLLPPTGSTSTSAPE